jgi:hypothetical protein
MVTELDCWHFNPGQCQSRPKKTSTTTTMLGSDENTLILQESRINEGMLT